MTARGAGGLWRLAERRVRAEWSVAGLAWLLLVAATTLPAAGFLYGDRVALGARRATFAAAAPRDRTIDVRLDAPADELARIGPAVTAAVQASLVPGGGEVARVEWLDGLVRPAAIPGAGADGVAVATYEGLADHATLSAGRWASPGHDPFEATLSTGAAEALGLRVGDALLLEDPRDPGWTLRATIVGTWHPRADDPYWLGGRLELDGSETVRATIRGPLVVDPADLAARIGGRTVGAEWRALPSIDGLNATSSTALAVGASSLRAGLPLVIGPVRGVTVTSGLPDLIRSLEDSIFVGRAIIALLIAQLGVLAGYALVLVGSILAERRRDETALLLARGGSTGHTTVVALAEGAILAVPATLVATQLAGWIVELLVSSGPIAAVGRASTGSGPAAGSEPGTLLVAGLGAGLGVLALAVPVALSGASLPGIGASLGRRISRTFAQRLGLDLVLLILAGIALWQLRAYGAPIVAAGGGRLVDPLLVIAPALGLLAGAVLVIRLVPRLAELGERGLGRLRSAVLPLFGREIARRPGRHTRVALLVVLAAALAGLAAAHAATWTRSQSDQAAYRVPTDVRVVTAASSLPDWLAGSAFRGVAGVATAVPIVRGSINEGAAAGGQLLAVDPAELAALKDLPASAQRALPTLLGLVAGRPALGEVALPPGTQRLALTLDSDLRVLVPAGAPAVPASEIANVDVSALIVDPDGTVSRATLGSAVPVGMDQRLELTLAGAIDGRPLLPPDGTGLAGIELTVAPSLAGPVGGRLELREVAASTTLAGAAWTRLAVDPAGSGWSWTRIGGRGSDAYLPAGPPGRVDIGSRAGQARPVGSDGPGLSVTFRLWSAPAISEPLPALVSDGFLALTHARVGDVVDGSMVAAGTRLRVVGTTDLFPTLDPGRPFVVIDRATVERARLLAAEAPAPPAEWWLALTQGAASPGPTLLHRGYPVREVLERSAVTAALVDDPVSLGIIGALVLGALAALALAAIGFIAHAAISTRERVVEFALLRALGVSELQLTGWLWLEHAVVLVFSIVVGSLIGVVLTWLIIPAATLTSQGTAPVPAASIVVPGSFVLALFGSAGVLLAVTLLIIVRLVGRIRIGATLREREA